MVNSNRKPKNMGSSERIAWRCQIDCMIHRHHFNIIGDYEQRNSTKTRMD